MEPDAQAALSAIQTLVWLLAFYDVLPAKELVFDLERSARMADGATELRLQQLVKMARGAANLPWSDPA